MLNLMSGPVMAKAGIINWEEMALLNSQYWYADSCYVISKGFAVYVGWRFMNVLARTRHCPSVKRSEHITATFTILLRLLFFPLQGLPIVLFDRFFFFANMVYTFMFCPIPCQVTPVWRRSRLDNPVNKRLGIIVLKLLIVYFLLILLLITPP